MTSDASATLDALAARCVFPPRGALQCAVSGGADSLALLALAAHHCSTTGQAVVGHHVDHQLQPGERARGVVTAAAEQLGVSMVFHTVDVAPGSNLEMRARSARYAVLPVGVLTGHTVDDQAETVLLQLMRGAGPQGLGAMDPGHRPLLKLRRSETTLLCERLAIEVYNDPTNESTLHRRNRVRHELLPLLSDISDRDVVPLLSRTADIQREVAALLDSMAGSLDPTDSKVLGDVDPLLAATALRRWWRAETGSHYAPDRAAIERMLDVVSHRSAATDVCDGWRLERTGGVLRLVPPEIPVDWSATP